MLAQVATPPGKPPAELALALRERGQSHRLGVFAADEQGRAALGRALGRRRLPREVTVTVPPDCLLERQLELPPAAAPALREVLQLEIERLTPFAPADLLWTWSAAPRRRGEDALRLRLAMVPRAAFGPTIAALGRLGLPATTLEAAAAGGPAWRFDLRPPAPYPRLRRALGVACVALALVALLLPLALRWQAEATLDAELARLRAPMAEVATLRRSLQQGSASAGVLAEEMARLRPPLQALAALTAALDDDSFLQELAIEGDSLLLTGQSSAAARLLGSLAATPGFHDPVFVAPVRRTEDGRAELFSLRVGYRP